MQVRGSNLKAMPVAPGTEAPPDLNQKDAASINSGIDDLDNLPEAPKAMPIQPGHSDDLNWDDHPDAVHHGDAGNSDQEFWDSFPDAGGQLGHVYDAVYHGDPDNVAKVLNVSDKFGAHPALVAANIKDAEKAANGPSGNFFQSIEDKFPGTTKFLQTPRNMAIAHDDIDNVAKHEELVHGITQATDIASALKAGWQSSVIGLKSRGAMPDTELPPDAPVWNRLAAQAAGLTGDFPSMIAGGAAGAEVGASVGAAAGGFAGAPFAGVGAIPGMMAGAAAGTLIGGGAGAFAAPAAIKEYLRQKYEMGDVKGVADGMDRAGAILKAATKQGIVGGLTSAVGGAVAMPFEMAGAKALLPGIFENQTLKTLAPLAAENIMMTKAGNSIEGRDTKPQDYLDTALLIGAMHGATHLGETAAEHYVEAKKTAQSVEFYDGLGEAGGASKVLQRLPRQYEAMLGGLTKDSPVENVYIPQEAFDGYFQSKNVDPSGAADSLGVGESYKAAQETGGDITIPTEAFVRNLVKTEHYQGLRDDIKFDPEGLTVNEIKSQQADIQSQIADADAKAHAGILTPEESAQIVFDERHKQLTDVGLGPQEAKLGATLHSHAFRTLAERTGQVPHEVAQRFKLEIQRRQELMPTADKSFNQDPLGRISFEKGKAVMDLFKDANKSTFFHESGHYFLEVMHHLSNDENAPQSVKDDMKTIRDWMGLKDGEEIGTPQHEKFARGFEAYLREGVAPSEPLKAAFSKFKQWLVQIYKSVKGLDVELSPEIRGVMDRMLATDEEVARAHKSIGLNQGGLSEPRVASLAFQAREQAESEIMREQMAEMTTSNKEFVKSERSRLTEDAKKQVSEQPVYRAIEYIKDQVGSRKNIESMAKKFLDGKLAEDDVTHFETAAELQGVFADGKELALNIVNSGATDHFNKAVQDLVDQGMSKHADLVNTGKIRSMAMEKVHNEKLGELLALERNILANKIKDAQVRTEVSRRNRLEARVAAQAAKDQAHEILASKSIRDASNARIYVTAERNSAARSQSAAARGDFARAAEFKRQQMLNHALASEAMKNKALAEKSVDYLTDASKRGGDLQKMPYAFNRQADQILERFGFKQREPEDINTLRQIAKDMEAKGEDSLDIANATGMIRDSQSGLWRSESLRDFLSRVNDNYLALQIPDSVLSGAGVNDYKSMKMGELSDLSGAIKLISDAGQKYNRFLNEFIKVDMKMAAATFKKSVLDLVGARYAEERKIGAATDSGWKQKVDNIKKLPDSMISTLVNTLTLCHYLDGGKQGPAHDFIYRPIKQAEDRKFTRYAKMREDISGKNGIFGQFYTPKELAEYKKEATKLDGRSITKENILAMALNWGNESNRDRIRAGYGARDGSGRLIPMSDTAIEGLFKHLGKKDWDFAQATWKYLDSFWPEISALEMKMRGVEPERVAPAPFVNDHGAYEGGYYPIAYDFEKSSEAFKSDQMKNELYKQYSATRAQTESGHAQARVSFVARPVRLSLDVLFNHLENVIHDLEFRPAVVDTSKFLAMPDVKKTLEDAIGMPAKRGLDTWLKSIASDQSENLNWIDKKLQWARFGTTIAQLGLTPKAFLLHFPSNVTNAIWEMGVKNTTSMMTKAALDVAMGRGELKDFVFSKSDRMKQRLTIRDRDIMDMSRAWQGTAAGVIPHYAFMALHFADEAVSIPLWSEVYKKNLASLGHAGAVNVADETVTRTLGSGSKVDQINLQRGGERMKLMTMFYSWESVMFNRMWLDGKLAGLEYRKENVGAAASILAKATLFGMALPALNKVIADSVISNGLSDDEKKKRAVETAIENPLAMLPFVRDIGGAAIRRGFGEAHADYRMSPVESALQNVYNPVADGAHIAFTSGKHFDEKYAEEVARGMSQVSGYPQQLNTWAFNFWDYVQNNGEASMKDFLSRRRKK